MGVFSNKISRDDLKPGDHIYSWRNAYLYSHHGIYAGEEKVIHFTRGPGQEIGTGTVLDNINFSSSGSSDRSICQCAVCGDQSNLSGVISSCLDSFLWGGGLYRFEYGVSHAFFLAKRGGTCTLAKSDPPEDALFRASHLLANGFGVYDVFKNNCEDFAIYCKTGLLVVTDIPVGRSGQATTFVAVLDVAVTAAVKSLLPGSSLVTAVVCGKYFVNRIVYDIGKRRDVMKIPVEELVDQTNLSKPTKAAIAKPTEAAIAKQMETAIAKQTEAAIVKPIETAVTKPMETAISKQTETTIAKPTKAIIAQQTETAIAKPMETTIASSAEIAVVEPMEAGIAKQTGAAIAKSIETAVAKPMDTAIAAIAKQTEIAIAKPNETAIAKPMETAIAKS